MKTLRERFDEKWIGEPNSGCWLWTAHINQHGYGRLIVDYKVQSAHRISWTLNKGEIPEGLNVLHRCDMPCCVNPDHLFLGTQSDNMKDRANKGRIDLRGKNNPNSKLNHDQVLAIKNSSERSALLATQYGVHKHTIWCIRSGQNWRHLS